MNEPYVELEERRSDLRRFTEKLHEATEHLKGRTCFTDKEAQEVADALGTDLNGAIAFLRRIK